VVVDLASGDRLASVEISGLEWPDGAFDTGPSVGAIDLLGDVFLLEVHDYDQILTAVWADMSASPVVWRDLPVDGHARLLRQPLDLGS
jgi:hypothetical protein